MVNPELADILIGYKNALDAALMATRLIPGDRSTSRGVSGSNIRLPPLTTVNPRRTDTLEVCQIVSSVS